MLSIEYHINVKKSPFKFKQNVHKKSVKVKQKGIAEKSEKITPTGACRTNFSVSKVKKEKTENKKEENIMHMADALVAPAVAATMYVCSGGAAGFSVKKVRLESDPKKSR